MASKLTVETIRENIRDRDAEDNLLLDSVDFKDYEILAAMHFAAAKFNDLPPLIVEVQGDCLPWKYWAIQAVQESLYETKISQLERNAFVYKAGNTAYDEDQEQIKLLTSALSRLSRWRSTAAAWKRTLNYSDFYGEC